MINVCQAGPLLIRSGETLVPSVSMQLIITLDCCDLVPMPRQLEPCLRTISYREMEGNKGNIHKIGTCQSGRRKGREE